ncbi:MAG: ABC transporter substrate-binding protein, partial [Desulfuromonadales bacterium]|nr:ABC transporter substrate-binding protein [Desulfuromonadales bacterium]
ALPSPAEIQRLGERMYRDGLFPSGEPVTAIINGDVKVPGTAFSCVGCHLRSGIGSMEGLVLTPPTNGAKLYKPYYQYPPMLPPDPDQPKKNMMDASFPKPIYRPAYTDETLAKALTDGIDPVGRPLNAVMPRYSIEDRDMAILIAYLKTLSAEVSPGVDAKTIRFATVIAGNVPADQRKEMLAMLDYVMQNHNRKTKRYNRRVNNQDSVINYPQMTLSRWELTGPSHTWRAQLEEYYRKEPVFALLGGLSEGDWQPMHEFSEQNRIPCLLPITDLPVVSETDWYTLYFNKGVYQEGEASARHLAQKLDPDEKWTILQIVEDSPWARAVAKGFQSAWQGLGRPAPVSVYLPAGQKISGEKLRRLVGQEQPAAVLLWTASGTLPALETLAEHSDDTKMVYVSTTLLQQDVKAIPEKARGFTYISYPYRLSQVPEFTLDYVRSVFKNEKIPVSSSRISTRLYALNNVLLEPFQVVKRNFNPGGLGGGRVTIEEMSESLLHVRRNYYRDYLFDVIGMLADKDSLDYERLSFGPDQRYASKGCYIVQLSKGKNPEIVRKSDWVIH